IHPTPSPVSAADRAARMSNLGFGRVFTEHMVTVRYNEEQGWHDGQLVPYGSIVLDPASSVLHYGQAIFEGFKAYRQPDGGISTFRPEANAQRFAQSATRLAMPPLPLDWFLETADTLIRQDQAWVPPSVGESLYLRPLMIATEAVLGVRPASEYLFLLFGSPSGAYFPKGVKPVSVWIATDYVRAAPGGTGAAKCAGNYAASLVAQRQANEEGCEQVVWLDAIERKYIEEMGGMNLFFVYQSGDRVRLVTPKLTGSLLAGVTRDSLLTLARDLGYEAEETMISVEQWKADVASGAMTEAFACGTAAVLTPIGQVKSLDGSFTIHGGETGPVASRLRAALLDLQHGRSADAHGWMHRVAL
ncbi:MAG TPA: branched-chain amino acid aminotransferase, partial [Polyangiaceae bacterium]|nr:branched-chain amino acid aminotransferase [Polyangiaceae bacterium]